MFEGMDFGAVGQDNLKFISDFFSDPKNLYLKTELTGEQIKIMTLCVGYMDMLSAYYGRDFRPFKTLSIIIEEVIKGGISKDRRSRAEFAGICKGVMDSVDYNSMIDKLARKDK